MELPPYRIPTLRSIGKHVWFRTELYLKKIGGIILVASIIVWVLSNFPRNRSLPESERQSKSFMGMIGHSIEPVMKPLGFDWRLSVSVISGVAAKEVVVSTLGVLFQTENQNNRSLVQKIQSEKDDGGNPLFSPLAAFSFMLFILTYFPCIGVVSAIRRESGSWKWAAFIVLYTTGVAWLLSFSAFQLGSLL
jgi:ferrous iron transport protein B